MQKEAYAASPIGSAARLFNPILSDVKLDMLGGVGQYTLPQRGAGMALGAVLGSYLSSPENRELGATVGAGTGYVGSMGVDAGIRSLRRNIVNDAIRHGVSRGTINTPSIDDVADVYSHHLKPLLPGKKQQLQEMTDLLLRNMSTPAFTASEGAHQGAIQNNYNYMHKLFNSEAGMSSLDEALTERGLPRKVVDNILAGTENFRHYYSGMPSPDVAEYPFLSHELLERKDLFYNKNPIGGRASGEYVGEAFDTYGPGIEMEHNSLHVLGDEANLAQRTYTPEELRLMKALREGTGEDGTISATRRIKDMYSGIIPDESLDSWAKTTDTAIRRGLDTGKLLTEAEQAVIDAGFAKRMGASAGSALRRAEASTMDFIQSGLEKLFDKSKKYLPKLL